MLGEDFTRNRLNLLVEVSTQCKITEIFTARAP